MTDQDYNLDDLEDAMDHDPDIDGKHDDDDECGPPVNRDIVDDCLESLIEMLVKSGYDDEIADKALYTALESLMESRTIGDTPDLDQPDTVKHQWIANATPLVRRKLREMGLDLEEDT